MEATRVIKTIKTNVLPELDKYIGKEVEIIIISNYEKNKIKSKNTRKGSLKKLYGSCPDLSDGVEIQNLYRNEWDD